MLEQKFNFPVKDLTLIYHLKPKNVCVALKLWMVCVFEVVTISAIFVNVNYHGFYQWDVWANSALGILQHLDESPTSANQIGMKVLWIVYFMTCAPKIALSYDTKSILSIVHKQSCREPIVWLCTTLCMIVLRYYLMKYWDQFNVMGVYLV